MDQTDVHIIYTMIEMAFVEKKNPGSYTNIIFLF